jgi:hypothetical protein
MTENSSHKTNSPYNFRHERRYTTKMNLDRPNDKVNDSSSSESEQSLDVLMELDVNTKNTNGEHALSLTKANANDSSALDTSENGENQLDSSRLTTLPSHTDVISTTPTATPLQQTAIDNLAPIQNEPSCSYHIPNAVNTSNNNDLQIIHFLRQINTNIDTIKSEVKTNIDTIKSEVKANIDTIKSEVKANIDTIKSEVNTHIDTKIDTIQSEVRTQIDTYKQILDQQILQITTRQDLLQTEITETKNIQTFQKEELINFKSELQEQMTQTDNELRRHINHSLITHLSTVENKLKTENELIYNHVSEQLVKCNQYTKLELLEHQKTNQIQSEKIVTEHTTQLQNKILPQINDNKDTLNEHQCKIQYLNSAIDDHKIEIENLKVKTNNNQSPQNSAIQVVCTAAESNFIDRNLPKFNGRSSSNPNEALTRIKRYYERSLTRQPDLNPHTQLIDILETCFEGHASRWLQLIKNDIHNWESFADEFLRKFWSRELQKGIKARIENERYRTNGTLSRSEYFTERVITLQSITPTMSEAEIVSLLAERFEQIIQDSRTVQNIQTIREFEALLQREDIRESQSRTAHHHDNKHLSNDRHRNSPPNNYYNNQPISPQHNRVEPRAYQPRSYYENQYQNNGSNRPNWYNPNNYNNRQPPRYNSNNNNSPYNRNNQPQRFSQNSRQGENRHQFSSIQRQPHDQDACVIMDESSNSYTTQNNPNSDLNNKGRTHIPSENH